MKKIIYILMMVCVTANAVEVGSGFSYQGELLDNGSPANDDYDFLFRAYDASEGGTAGAVEPTVDQVSVTNGLFYIESIDFGDMHFTGEAVWLEINVRKTSEGGAYTTLTTRQRISAVPYSVQAEFAVDALSAANADNATNANNATNATNAQNAVVAQSLAAGAANSGDYLKFNGVNWVPEALSITPSPWSENGNDVYITGKDIGIGTASPSVPLHVDSNNGFELARFDGGNQMFNTFYENGVYRGYIGSYQDGTIPGTSSNDFEVGTGSSSTGSMHVVTKATPRITVKDDGKVGIGQTLPSARLQVDGANGETAMQVRSNGNTSFSVESDGSVNSIADFYAYQDANVTGNITVYQEINAKGDTRQDYGNNGMIKFLVKARCRTDNNGNPNPIWQIISQYNATNTAGTVTITDSTEGYHCQLSFPVNVKDRYWTVSLDDPWGVRSVSCGSDPDPLKTNILHCSAYTNFEDLSAEITDFRINVIVY
ncbi:MAG: hypothetical protein R3F25_04060 [Gammaproteobacteria bacterium]|jgi:hypothetical protein|nr:hypothetical protein [Xanthomonadales bacterium]